jgi:hypothetical protein
MPRVGFEPATATFERTKTITRLRPRGHCDRQLYIIVLQTKRLCSSLNLSILIVCYFLALLEFKG